MNRESYLGWRIVTEADFVSMFIKTWFAYISTLRKMFPEAYNIRGDKKYLNVFKCFYQSNVNYNMNISENVLKSLNEVYKSGTNIIINQFPEYYLWDFFKSNENFRYSYKDISPDRNDGLVLGLKVYRNRGTRHSFKMTGFFRFWGTVRGNSFTENIKFEYDFSSISEVSKTILTETPTINEHDYLSSLLNLIQDGIFESFNSECEVKSQTIDRKSIKDNYLGNIERGRQLMRRVFILNAKSEDMKDSSEMSKNSNSYTVISQRPINYFMYHMVAPIRPERDLESIESFYYNNLEKRIKEESIIWFLDFVYRLRNALFHEIIDPLDEQWQLVFKNAYLILKEIVDGNIEYIIENMEV